MMQNLFSKENILSHLRQTRSNQRDLQIIKLLEKVEKHECESKTVQHKIVEDFLQILLNGQTDSPNTDGAIFSCVILLTYLQEQEKLPCLNEDQFNKLWQWLVTQQELNKNSTDDVVCKIITAIGNLFALHPENGNRYCNLALQMILKNIVAHTAGVFLLTTLQCLKKILSTFKDVKLSEEQCIACAEAGDKLLALHCDRVRNVTESSNILVLILCTFQIMHKIVALNANFAYRRTGELLGLSKTYFQFGVNADEITLLPIKVVYVSQQALHVLAKEIGDGINLENAQNCGGKTPKARKPRTVIKNIQSNELVNRSETLLFDMKTSESDISEPESSSNRILFERSRKAKIRLAAIELIGLIARTLERRTLFGYWHALFPSGAADSNDNLLYVAQHDPNLRCRSAALQVCVHLLCGSKGFLYQAEIDDIGCPKAYIPFSISLGYTVLAIYKGLSKILSSESALPVLTQALKCLAVLVQASPFHQFKQEFVQNFVRDVKPFVYHRDATIQVSALMVMEFMAALQETTDDIAEAIGLPQEAIRKKNTKLQHTSDEDINIIEVEEFVESDEEIDVDRNADELTKNITSNTQDSQKTSSWLLKRILHNLSKHDNMSATSVRIESLQVLMALSTHFAIIKSHLLKISEILLYSLNDILPDVRLYAARCLDACAYQISRYLLDKTYAEADLQECKQFWHNMLPFIMKQIRDTEETTTLRITLCDALSNIGCLMFEHTPHTSQIGLLSFLSGVSSDSTEETIVRAAGARALAVFALYPSLRNDFVFIENTAEVTLRLVNDANLLVRTKSFWALGNISDALVGKETEITQLKREHISNDLLFRLIVATTKGCSDHDKVRCNAVRTIGNLLRLLNDDHLKMPNKSSIVESINRLSDCIRSSGSAKVKWNTCYAIKNLLRNPTIYKCASFVWQGKLFPVLCHVIVNHPNFKVRIHATAAVTSITERINFGDHYEKFWSSVMEAIEKSNSVYDIQGYKHQESLQEQLCLALAHIINLAGNDDFPVLKKHLLPRLAIIQHIWRRVINRMVPEKAAPLLSCAHLLLKRGCPPGEHRNTLIFLIETFTYY